ncbi:hypothetical protein KR222_007010 [Zaprionus bogoriensis]|nr:hypothetical protein KR222_007010 [Zaprionus bogoriensis]
MGKLTLYGFDLSPPVRPVKLTLAALQLPYDYVVVNTLKKEQHSEEFLKKNPQHIIPMLEDDGACIWDSHAIIAYLVNKYGKDDSLYPKDPLKRAIVDQRLHFESSVVFADALKRANMAVFFSKVLPKDRVDAIQEAYRLLEIFLKDYDYAAGDQLTIADFSLIAPISSLTAYSEIDPVKYPRISAWIKRMEELPYYSENGNGNELFKAAVRDTKFTLEA